MPIQMSEDSGGEFSTIHVSGVLSKTDFEHFGPEFDRRLRQHGKLRVLFDMADFRGWEPAAMWEEIKFDIKHFADIERMAMVGDKQWQHLMAMLGKPFVKAEIRYFGHADFAGARTWLLAAET
jgi:hypothetical protein